MRGKGEGRDRDIAASCGAFRPLTKSEITRLGFIADWSGEATVERFLILMFLEERDRLTFVARAAELLLPIVAEHLERPRELIDKPTEAEKAIQVLRQALDSLASDALHVRQSGTSALPIPLSQILFPSESPEPLTPPPFTPSG